MYVEVSIISPPYLPSSLPPSFLPPPSSSFGLLPPSPPPSFLPPPSSLSPSYFPSLLSLLQREALEQEERDKERERERAEKAVRLFGGAKPVDTASREKEIEEKLQREKEEFEKKLAEQSKEDRDDRGSSQERQRDGSRDRARDR